MFEITEFPDPLPGWGVPGVERPATAALSERVVVLQAACAALADVDLALLGEAGLLADSAATLAAIGVLQHLSLRQVAEVDRRHAHRSVGAASTSRWLASQGVEAPAAQVTAARRLRQFPVVAARLAAGTLAAASAHRLQTALASLRTHVDRADGLVGGQPAGEALAGVIGSGVRMLVGQCRGGLDADLADRLDVAASAILSETREGVGELARLEQAFLLLGDHVEPAQLAECLRVLRDALLPAEPADRERTSHEQRELRLTRDPGGGWTLSGRLDVDCGERLHAFLQAQLVADADPGDTATAADLRGQGLDPYDPDLAPTLAPRSTRQRLHDALRSGLARVLGGDLLGTHDKQPVQVVVTVGADTLDRTPGALPGRTGSGTAVSCDLVRRWACGSALTRHVLALTGQVVATSHTQRTLTRAERRALHTRTGGRCQGAGCSRSTCQPGTVLHPHHADPWATTGTTSLADTVHLCDSCHTHVHHGHRLRLKDGRRLGPDGWVDP